MRRRSGQRRASTITTAAVAFAVIGGSCLLTSCTIDVLGGPGYATDINEAGDIVGGWLGPGPEPVEVGNHGYRRLPDGTVIDLPPLPDYPYVDVRATNEAGTTVGVSFRTGGSRAVRWDPSGQVTDLIAFGGPIAEAWGLNDRGVVVGQAKRPGDAERHAFVIDPDVGHAVALPELPGSPMSFAFKITNDDQILGHMMVDGFYKPVRWDLASGAITLLEPLTGLRSVADINEAGAMIGLKPDGRPALWVPGGAGLTDLGLDWGYAAALDERSTTVVGSQSDDDGNGRAFRWTQTAGVEWLSVPQSRAWDVNERGTIVGSSDGKAVIFVPEPPS